VSDRREVVAYRPESDTDLALVLRAREGDQTAFRALWDKHWPGLRAYFAKRIHSREEAEDLASETLLAAYDQLPAFRGLASEPATLSDSLLTPTDRQELARQCTFRTYLYVIARHKLARWIRRKKSRSTYDFTELVSAETGNEETHTLEERLGADSDSDPLDALLREAQQDEMCYALADVALRSSEQFKALVLHYGCKLPHKEIATLLDTRSETVNTRLQEGRRTLLRHFHRASESASRASVSC
jgi:RNA polymerase sigma factor (sigma-70 family)